MKNKVFCVGRLPSVFILPRVAQTTVLGRVCCRNDRPLLLYAKKEGVELDAADAETEDDEGSVTKKVKEEGASGNGMIHPSGKLTAALAISESTGEQVELAEKFLNS